MRRAALVLGLSSFLACVIACGGAGSGTGGSTSPDRKAEATRVTKEMFDRIEIGDSLETVVTVAGFPDETVSHDKVKRTWVYQWRNADGSWMSVTIQGDNVAKKLQVGLK